MYGSSVKVNDDVEVFNAFVGAWTGGFRIARVVEYGYRLKRASDGTMLPTVTGEADVRIVRAAT